MHEGMVVRYNSELFQELFLRRRQHHSRISVGIAEGGGAVLILE